ncbi:hypothetical protein TorRG33x02_072310 [Trema orientale]|uniref:Uncharacterized protein n=1 Tax=Trema orientale TaxID=63057 RepID=A0A2P5FGG0_TREOI|nr:hypothetical protein TorRG33x02_072310 [Trema orientale]
MEDGRRRRSAAAKHRWLQREEVDSDKAGVHDGEKRPRRRVGDEEVGSDGVDVDGEKHPWRRLSRTIDQLAATELMLMARSIHGGGSVDRSAAAEHR